MCIHQVCVEKNRSTPRFYLAAVEKNRSPIFLHSCKIKSGRGRPGYEVGRREGGGRERGRELITSALYPVLHLSI